MEPSRLSGDEVVRWAVRLRQSGSIDPATLAESLQAWLETPGLDLNAWLAERTARGAGETRPPDPTTLADQIGGDFPTAVPTVPDPTLDPYATQAEASPGESLRTIDPASPRYQSIRSHAKGGLGEVYLAHDLELRREVALKEIQERHAANPASRARFLVEAEITGALEHPGIVPVYGLGQHPDGRPFYAMRFIHGDSLEAEIREHFRAIEQDPSRRPPGLRALLRRFLDVCNTLSYAHSRGVIHRDLKPANIMVGRYGETLVVDWGLARASGTSEAAGPSGESRAIDPSALSGSFETLPGSLIGTPGFMSPEQAEGRTEEIDARSDIYSLGATLYQILTGRPPFGGDSLTALLEKVKRGDFPAPRSVRPDVPKPLDAICRKAMAQAPGNRYANPADLAADLDRWLADEPVSAYSETRAERLARWTRRHRQATVAAGFALVAIASVATVASLVTDRARRSEAEARSRAEASFQQAKTVVDTLITQLAESRDLKETPRGDDFRRQLLADARDYYREFVKDAAHSADPAVLRESAESARRLARIESETGDRARAAESYEEAVGLLARIVKQAPADANARESLASSLVGRSILLHQLGRLGDAEADVRQAYALLDRLAAENPDHPRYRRDALRALNNLATILAATGRTKESEDAQRRILASREARYKDRPDTPDAREDLVATLNNLANLESTRGDFPAALQSIGRAIALTEARLKARPDDPEAAYLLASLGQTRGDLLAQTGETDRAKSNYEQSRDRLEQLVADHPGSSAYLEGLARSEDRLGVFTEGTGGDPEPHYAAAARHFETLMRRHPQLTDAPRELGNALGRIGDRQVRMGRIEEARKTWTRAGLLLEAAVRGTPDPRAKADLAQAYRSLARLDALQERPEQARSAVQKAIQTLRSLQEAEPDVVRFRTDLAGALEQLGDLAEEDEQPDAALDAFQEADRILSPLLQPGRHDPLARLVALSVLEKLASVAAQTGHPEVAAPALSRAIEFARAERRARPDDRDVQSTLAQLLELSGYMEEDAGRDATTARVEVVALRRDLARNGPKDTVLRNRLANALVRLAESHGDAGRLDEALKAIREAIDIHASLLADDAEAESLRQPLSEEHGLLGELLRERGDFPEALQSARNRRGLWLILNPNPRELAEAAADLALLVEHDPGRLRESLSALRQAVAAGFKDVDLFDADGPFRFLRDDREYQEVLGSLYDRVFPLDPFE